MKNRFVQILCVSISLIISLLFAAVANAQSSNGRMWVFGRESANMTVIDRATGTELKVFDVGVDYPTPCNLPKYGGGVAHDPTDGNIWISILGGEGTCGDGWIHKIPAMGGPEIKRIPDPTKNWLFSSGIGALDYDSEENVLYAVSRNQGNGTAPWIFKLDADSGAVLNSFTYPDPQAAQMHTLAIDRPDRLNGRKVLIVSNGGGTVDIDTGAPIDGIFGVGRGWGIDVDEITGTAISSDYTSVRGDISLEDGYRCDCKKIAKPQSQIVSSNWSESGLNWSMGVEVSDNDGLVLHDVKLGQRYLAKMISVPYYTLETSAFSSRRAELKPDSGNDPVASSQLINYQVFSDDQKLIIQATYLIDRIPSPSKSCLHLTQRYEFYKRRPGDKCEPSGTLPCSRWKPIVKYKFFGKDESLTALSIAQRQHITVDDNPYNTVGLFRDHDYPVEVPLSLFNFFSRWCNPLPHEWSDQIVSRGKNGHTWDNIHQTFKAIVEEPQPKFLTNGQFIFIEPGCPECLHNHWRWGRMSDGEGNGNLIGIAPTSTQDAYFAIVRYHPGEEDPTDYYHDLLTPREDIRTSDTIGSNPLQVRWGRAPEEVVYWASAVGYEASDTFFFNSRFFNPTLPTQQLYSGQGGAPIQFINTATKVSSNSFFTLSTQDELTSITAASVYVDGATTVVPFDSSLPGALPQGYTAYSTMSYDVESEAESSGPYNVTFGVPSVADQTAFNGLRIFHVEQDPYDPENVVWVDRTILPPDPQAPDFANKRLTAMSSTLGQFVVASLTQPQPPITTVAEITASSSDSSDPVIAGNNLTYTINITNCGPATATGVLLNDSLSPDVSLVSHATTQGSCKEIESTVVCKLGTLAAAASASVTIVVRPVEGPVPIPAEGMAITNTASITANEIDTNNSDNTVAESSTVLHDPNAAPTVSFTNPVSGNVIVGPANITLTADATDSDGSISRLEFFDGGELIGTGTATGSNQYSLEWNNVDFGNHSLVAVATDNAGKSNTSNPVSIVVNGTANVTITSPNVGQVFNRPVDITISASASYSGGTITNTDFYANGSLIGTALPSGGQSSISWTNVPSGSYALVVVATDDSGIPTASSPISITVNDYPEISLTNPTNAAQFTAPANINFTARASDIDGNISKVTFYANGLQIASRAPVGAYDYGFTWSSVQAGSYILTAVATDNSGATTTSNPVTVEVNAPPTVSLTSPANGAQFVTPTNITILSSATDSDGTISKVEFYANGVLKGIGTLAGPNQYSFTWTGANTGDYALTAVATDNRGATTTSASVPIKIMSPALFVTGSTTLSPSDSVVKARLEALNYVVTVKAASAAATADANGKALVVISSTVTPSAVGTKFRTVAVPLVTWESGLYANMGMSNTTNTSSGTTTKQTQVKIINPSHPMADGMSGQVGVTTTSGTLSWGKPNANAVSVATIVSDTSKVVIFGYQSGASMPGLVAPARRVGLFMEDTTAASFYGPGQRLFDAAIKWATGRI